MPGLVVNGKEVLVEGLNIINFKDDPRLVRGPEDGAARDTNWVRQVIIHTTRGIPGGGNNTPQSVNPGSGPDLGKEFDVNNYWTTSDAQSGAHLIIDTDGSIGCIADLQTEKMYHAGDRGVNRTSIGIEIYQMGDGSIYESSLIACVKLCNALAELFGIQKQIHWPYKKGPVFRLDAGGSDCVGFFGHRDVSNNRGAGDPGDIIMEMLMADGYEFFDFSESEDIDIWKDRQEQLGLLADGIPGPKTVEMLKSAGFEDGLWVSGDVDDFDSNLSDEEILVLLDTLEADIMSYFNQKVEEFREAMGYPSTEDEE